DVTFPPAVTSVDPEILKTYEGTYVLSGGGQFKVMPKGGVLLVNLDEQDAVNAMFNVKKVDAGTYDQLKSLSEKVFISALSGNFDEFGKALYDRDRMLGFLRDHIPMRLARHRERTGEIKEVFARVALPSETRGEKSAQIFVELKGEKGIIYFGLIWRNSKIVGIDAVMGIPDLSILFLPLTSTDFAGYHLDMARNFRISFLLNDGGNVTGLMLENEDGPVKAHKSK
ncbi:MAG: hypothetical protein WBF32_13865, partial [Candidatus Aminicenantaceae bacterium]